MKKIISMLALSSVLFGFSACSSEESKEDAPITDGRVFVKLDNVVGPQLRMTETAKTDKESAELHNGYIVFSTPNGGIRAHYEIVSNEDDVVDAHTILLDELREGKISLVVGSGEKHIICVANPPKEFRDLIATDVDPAAPILDEFGNPKTYKGETILVDIEPVHRQYEDLVKTLTLKKDYITSVKTTHRMLMVKDETVEIEGDQFLNAYVAVELKVPMARIDLHARIMKDEGKRVAAAR